ncbi:hypothetical protein QUB33_28210 [Microcoleus sp. B3-A4]
MKFKHSRGNDHSQTKWSGQYRKPRSGMLQLAMSETNTPRKIRSMWAQKK